MNRNALKLWGTITHHLNSMSSVFKLLYFALVFVFHKFGTARHDPEFNHQILNNSSIDMTKRFSQTLNM